MNRASTRRRFITVLAGLAAAPLLPARAARAQPDPFARSSGRSQRRAGQPGA